MVDANIVKNRLVNVDRESTADKNKNDGERR